MKSRSRILRGVAAKRVCIPYVFHIRVVKTLDEFIPGLGKQADEFRPEEQNRSFQNIVPYWKQVIIPDRYGYFFNKGKIFFENRFIR